MTVRRRLPLWWLLNAVLLVALAVVSVMAVRAVTGANRPSTTNDMSANQNVADFAKSATIKLLSYQADSAEEDLTNAAQLTTGEFHDSYLRMVNDVVIPGARNQHITTTATVPAVGAESVSATTASAIVFVNQKTTTGDAAPTDSTSSVRVKLAKIDGQWRVSAFDPI